MAIKRRKTVARRGFSTKVRSSKTGSRRTKARKSSLTGQTALKGKLLQAKRAEQRAIKKINAVIRRNKLKIEQMRKILKVKLAAKTKAAIKSRKELAKKYVLATKKIRKEYMSIINKLRKQLSLATKSSTKSSRSFGTKKRSTRSKSKRYGFGISKKTAGRGKRKSSGRKVISLHQHRRYNPQFRRAA